MKKSYFNFCLALSVNMLVFTSSLISQNDFPIEYKLDYFELAAEATLEEKVLDLESAQSFYEALYETKAGLFYSGQVYQGDVFTEYINKIADDLLKNDKDLRDAVKIYSSRLNNSNALSLADGSIFIDISLLPPMSTEAQLALVIAHEIAHYKFNHIKDHFQQEQNIKEEEENNKNSWADVFRSYSYSIKNELEADAWAIRLIIDAGYSPLSALETFKKDVKVESAAKGKIYLKKVLSNNHYNLDTSIMVRYSKYRSYADVALTADSRYMIFSHPQDESRFKAHEMVISLNTNENASNDFIVLDSAGFTDQVSRAKIEIIDNYVQYANYATALDYAASNLAYDTANQDFAERLIKCLYYISYYSNIQCLPNVLNLANYNQDESVNFLCGYLYNLENGKVNSMAHSYALKNQSNYQSEEYNFYQILISRSYVGEDATEGLLSSFRKDYPQSDYLIYLEKK